MRSLRKAAAAILLCISTNAHAENMYGRSFLPAQPFSLLPTDITHSMIMDQRNEEGSVLNKPQGQAVIFGGTSTNSDALRDYFLIDGKSTLKTNEAPASDTGSFQDLIGFDFNIQTTAGTQSSLITLNPKQTYCGFGLSFRYGFREKWWFTAETDFKSVKNDLDLTEAILTTGGSLNVTNLGFDGLPSTSITMIEAFKQSGMLYGKIDGAQTKRGISDIHLHLGYDFADRKDSYLAPYIGIVLPTSNAPKATYIWEPILGNNKHAGLILGAYGHSAIHENNGTHIWFTWSTKNQYLFENMQKRSFDLKRGPWTRYLTMYKTDSDRQSAVTTLGSTGKKTFGINLMTQDIYVTPGASNYSTMSFSVTREHAHATLGIATFIREAEDIRFVNQWTLGPEVADLGTGQRTNILRTISTLALNDGKLAGASPIHYEDIDLSSATNGNLFAGTLYATVGYYTASDYPQLYEIGALYETSKQNSAIDRFALWGKFQITF